MSGPVVAASAETIALPSKGEAASGHPPTGVQPREFMSPSNSVHLTKLFTALRSLPSTDGLMNPYHSAGHPAAPDSRDEIGAYADKVRAINLQTYLSTLVAGGSDVVLCGEAPGYAGCRFTGIAFTDEATVIRQRPPLQYAAVLTQAKAGKRPLMKERSGQIVWASLRRAEKLPILFNALPLHPHEPGTALTNRTPSATEVELGQESLTLLLEYVQPRLVVAVGRWAEKSLEGLGCDAVYVRHPARGGKPKFLAALERLGVLSPSPQTQLFSDHG